LFLVNRHALSQATCHGAAPAGKREEKADLTGEMNCDRHCPASHCRPARRGFVQMLHSANAVGAGIEGAKAVNPQFFAENTVFLRKNMIFDTCSGVAKHHAAEILDKTAKNDGHSGEIVPDSVDSSVHSGVSDRHSGAADHCSLVADRDSGTRDQHSAVPGGHSDDLGSDSGVSPAHSDPANVRAVVPNGHTQAGPAPAAPRLA
jgi:hypothetical protein